MIDQFTQTVELPLWAVFSLYAYKGNVRNFPAWIRERAKTKTPE